MLDFPAPEGPTNAAVWPGFISNEISLRILSFLSLLYEKLTLENFNDPLNFLISNGFDEYFDNLQKKLLLSEGMENLKINSQLSGLKALIDSNGLGGFYCLEAKKI